MSLTDIIKEIDKITERMTTHTPDNLLEGIWLVQRAKTLKQMLLEKEKENNERQGI